MTKRKFIAVVSVVLIAGMVVNFWSAVIPAYSTVLTVTLNPQANSLLEHIVKQADRPIKILIYYGRNPKNHNAWTDSRYPNMVFIAWAYRKYRHLECVIGHEIGHLHFNHVEIRRTMNIDAKWILAQEKEADLYAAKLCGWQETLEMLIDFNVRESAARIGYIHRHWHKTYRS